VKTNYSRLVGLVVLLTAGLITVGPAQALQCVPYARDASGIDLRGDAWKWWNAAAGAYERGHAPRLGAVLVFRKHAKMRLGHVAVVRKMIDARTMLIDHANWGPRGAGRGTVSMMVPLRDVSARNDWSEVRVWNVLTRDFGTQTYPTYGFIYSHGHHPSGQDAYVADLPEEVAAELEANSLPAPAPLPGHQPMSAVAAVYVEPEAAVDVEAVAPVEIPVVSYEPIVSAEIARRRPALDVQTAAQHPASGHYGNTATKD